MTDEQKQHLEFIQNTINRLSSNSMQLKAITITIAAGLLAVYTSNTKDFLLFIALAQIVFFWMLDGYYLQQERKFRGIYNDVCGVTNNNTIKDYEMPTKLYKKGKYRFFCSVFSLSKILFFGSMTLIMIIIILGLVKNYFS